ncbi:TPA: transcriptional regulator [Morganella morganii]|uniref:CII family transcriptional regulator n=1 Tax=Morganella morganii TaxID=582 RepID=UPI000D84E42B|nr:CII family transcriptional regulator [Morganella morganii]MBT0387729.1 transcriptional regulator [Morganella morganii subsp. morganii]SPX92009.1 Bacteriophage CII protein [Morganella morganii]HCT5325224.1 transcriptional regulator [Morganella morganii]HDU8602131.1 transcriptional regulator [Morganella morganii]
MELSNERKFREIETKILKGIHSTGAREIAHRTGIHESQISRWQSPQHKENLSFIQRCARLLAAIEYEGGEDMVVLQGDEARALIQMLGNIRTPKRKAPAVTEAKSQINLVLDED